MKKALYIAILLATTALVMYVVWFCYLWHISMPVYHFTKQPHGRTYRMNQADKSVGNALIHNTHAFFIWEYGDTVTLDTDSRGFRVHGDNMRLKDGLLFFGDSFTLCEELEAPEAYPFLVGEALCQPVHNAGVSGYGYPQMILRARQYVDVVAPDAVVFQVSPWLAERAVTPYMPALFFKVPSPYYNQLGNIVPPTYTTPAFELTQNNMLQTYRESEPSLTDKFCFIWEFTRPIFEKQYWEEFKSLFKPKGPEYAPLADPFAATELAIDEMLELSSNRILVFLVMGYNQGEIRQFQEKYQQKFTSNVIVVNADEVLWRQPGIITKEDHERAYCFWHGDPPVLVDYHYNAHANKLIAQALSEALQAQNQCP